MNTSTKHCYLQDTGKVILGSEVYILCDNSVLLHKRSETKKTFPGFWIGPGGHIDAEEDALTAAVREVKEETGVTILTSQLKLKSVAFHRHIDRNELYVLFVFRAEISTRPKTLPETSEGISRWVSVTDLDQMDNVFPASRYYFDHVIHARKGILYTNLVLENSQIITVSSHVWDA